MSDDNNPFSPHHAGQYSNQPTELPPHTQRRKSPWVWIVLLVVFITAMPFLCCGGLAIFGFTAAYVGIRAPIDAAVEEMNEDPAIAAKLGTPIESSSTFGVNDYENRNGNGNATINFEASGPRGSAKVQGSMDLTAGVWTAEDLTIMCDDGTKLTLP